MSVDQANFLREKIQTSLEKSSTQKAKLESTNRRFQLSSTLFSASSTFVAGFATLSGQGLVGSWRMTCGIAALLALGATIISGLQQNLVQAELLNKVNECVARLRTLQIETIDPVYDVVAVRMQYQTIMSHYPDVDL